MIGIPFTVRRFSARGVEEITLYLQTRRGAMRKALRAYHDAMMAQSTAAARVAGLMARAMQAEQSGVALDLEKLLAQQESEMAESSRHAEMAMAAAEEVARESLSGNYPDVEVDAIMDRLTDKELRAIVATVELGAMPADFFTSSGTPPSPSSIMPSGPSPESGSLKPDSPGGTSKPE